MKKLTLTLALILCLTLLVFAFASCNKKSSSTSTTAAPGTVAPSTTAAPAEPTTAAPTEPPHVHTPDTEFSTLTEPTCSAIGYQAKLCTECGEPIEETIEEIPINPNAHSVDDWTTVEPTLLSAGSRSGTCTLCHNVVNEVIEETFNEWKYTTESTDVLSKSKNIGSQILTDGKHFYPTDENPDGLDLYIEFSFLWNAGLLKMSSMNDSKAQVLTGCINDQDAYWMALTTNAYDCGNKVAPGGFEYVACRTVEFGPDGMSQTTANNNNVGNTFADFPNIGGADQANPEWGWHRVAIVVHEEVLNEAALKADNEAGATNAQYLFSFTCYIDGVKIYQLSNRSDPAFKESTYRTGNMLYTAQSDGEGGITYTDISSGFNVNWIKIPTSKTTEGTAYAVYVDEAIFAGTAFAQNVEKVTAPADNVYTAKDGTEVPAKIWYQFKAD